MGIEAVLLKPEEAAEAMRISRSRVYEMLASGQLRSISLGRSRRIPAQAVRDLVERLQVEQAPEPELAGAQR